MRIDFQSYEKKILHSISSFIQIPTVYDAATISAKMPYGEKVYAGYEWMKTLAKADGFHIEEYEGHALAIELPGNQEGKKRIDVISHIDVVATGEGWERDPFSGEVTEEAIWGRGTQDMKSALMLTYYGLKYIKDHNISCKNNIRLVLGCDEERTMQDIHYYKLRAGEPEFAFTPDGRFPYCLGEKGAIMWRVTGKVSTLLETLDGGTQCNVISPMARAIINSHENIYFYRNLIKEKGYVGEIATTPEGIELTLHGNAAHASLPELGSNANVQLLDIVQEVTGDPIATLLYRCFSDSYGRGANIHVDIAPMGKLTLNLGVIRISKGLIYAEIDCRYPKGITSEELTKRMEEALYPLEVSLCYDDKPSLIEDNQRYLSVLVDAYQEVTGDKESEPYISGGVTYSKVFGNCVSFGPLTQGELSLAHQANEHIKRQDIEKLFSIYTQSMIRLANV